MTSDDDRELARLTELHVSGARACLEHFRTAPAFVVERENVRAFNATYPVVAHAIKQIAAALILRDQGLDYPARANVRVAFEHALIAQSVVHTHDGEDLLIASMDALQRNILDDMRRGGAELTPELLAELGRSAQTTGSEGHTDCRPVDGGKRQIYGLYRMLTGAVHVSLATLNAYMELRGEDRPPALLSAAKTDGDPDQILALGWSAILAVSAIESFRKGDPFREWINATAKNHELVADLSPFDTEPHRQRQPAHVAHDPV